MPNNETVRQHYVPRTYLKHFANERDGAHYIKALPTADLREAAIQEIGITNVCLQKDIYTLPGNTTEERMLLERFYSDTIEARYNEIYQLLTNPEKRELTPDERNLIITTVVTMLYRTTKWMNMHNEFMNRVLTQLFELCQQTGKDYFMFEKEKISIAGKTLEQLKRENKIESRPAQVLTQLKVALRLIEIRNQRDGIYVSKLADDRCEFVTSDNPVIYHNPFSDFTAPFSPENILTLPLDHKHKLFLMPYANDEDSKHLLIRHEVSGGMCLSEQLNSNYSQSRNAERFMLGKDSALKSYLATREELERPIYA